LEEQSVSVSSKIHPIKATPAKVGHAKLWVYRRANDHDRQAAEDHKVQVFGIIRLAYYKSRIFYGDNSPNVPEAQFTSADLTRVGSAS
jgi:hypothetical protein